MEVLTFKDAIERKCAIFEEKVPEKSFTHDELVTYIETSKQKNTMRFANDEVFLMVIDHVYPLVCDIQRYVTDFGYMNTFSYGDMYKIVQKCVSYDINEEDTNDDDDDEDDDITNF
jgi:hypothetical protein|uniref:Uncharacterized protein n=1 Tax=viral metagenome TaxID=1070528 RepID=A0A6C0BFX6_9ZZZZ